MIEAFIFASVSVDLILMLERQQRISGYVDGSLYYEGFDKSAWQRQVMLKNLRHTG